MSYSRKTRYSVCDFLVSWRADIVLLLVLSCTDEKWAKCRRACQDEYQCNVGMLTNRKITNIQNILYFILILDMRLILKIIEFICHYYYYYHCDVLKATTWSRTAPLRETWPLLV